MVTILFAASPSGYAWVPQLENCQNYTKVVDSDELSEGFVSRLKTCPWVELETNESGELELPYLGMHWLPCLYQYALDHLKEQQCMSVMLHSEPDNSGKKMASFWVHPFKMIKGIKYSTWLYYRAYAVQLAFTSDFHFIVGTDPETESKELCIGQFEPLGMMCRDSNQSPVLFGPIQTTEGKHNHLKETFGDPDAYLKQFTLTKECHFSKENKLEVSDDVLEISHLDDRSNMGLSLNSSIVLTGLPMHIKDGADMRKNNVTLQWIALYKYGLAHLKARQCMSIMYTLDDSRRTVYFLLHPLWKPDNNSTYVSVKSITMKPPSGAFCMGDSPVCPIGRFCKSGGNRGDESLTFGCLQVNGLTFFEFEHFIGDPALLHEKYKNSETENTYLYSDETQAEDIRH